MTNTAAEIVTKSNLHWRRWVLRNNTTCNWRAWRKLHSKWKRRNKELTDQELRGTRRGCEGKMAFPDFLHALKFIRSLESKKVASTTLNTYHCDICKMSHVGHTHTVNPAFLVDQQWGFYQLES